MKKGFTILTLLAIVFVMGCQNSELVNCQEENKALQSNVSLLQQDLSSAKSAIEKKDKTIEDLQSENVKMQTKAMEGIKTMMEKQAAKDKELKDKLAASAAQNTDLQKKLEQVTAELDQTKSQLQEASTEVETQVPSEQPVQQ